MATYTHYSGEMVAAGGTPELSRLFPLTSETGLDIANSTSTKLVFSYTPMNGGESGWIEVYGTGFTDFNVLTASALADTVTGWARFNSDRTELRDEITDVFFDASGGYRIGARDLPSPWSYFSGNDTFNGAEVGDYVYGGDGNDTMFGNDGDDILDGGAGSDTVRGGAGNDTVSGGGGNFDTFNNWVYGEAGDDYVYSDSHGNAYLYGGSGADHLFGDNGNDFLFGGGGADEMAGGSGDDTYFVENVGDTVVEYDSVSGGFDVILTTVSFAMGSSQLDLSRAVEVLDARNAASGVTLSAFKNYGSSILGSEHDDTINGSFYVDILNGRGGADTMTGFDSDDKYYVDNALDVVVEDNNNWGLADAVYASVDFTLADDQWIELVYANAGLTGLTLTGNAQVNTISGKGGGDTLDGAAGNDVLVGQAGSDRLIGGLGLDKLFGGADGDTFVLQKLTIHRDNIRDFEHGIDKLELAENVFGELDGAIAFADRFLSNADGLVGNGGNAETRIIYNATSGLLYFDADGTGAATAKLIATFQGAPVLDSGDFQIV